MKLNHYTMTYRRSGTLFRVRFYSPVFMNRKIKQRYFLRVKHALKNFMSLCTEILLYKPDSLYDIPIYFYEESSGRTCGKYNNARHEIYLSNEYLVDLTNFESTFFHELLHYIFFNVMVDENEYRQDIHEGFVLYFENLFYPGSYSNSVLLCDRFTTNINATGYYITERLMIENPDILRRYLNRKESDIEIELEYKAMFGTMAVEEQKFIEELLLTETDFVIAAVKPNTPFRALAVIYRKVHMDSPFIVNFYGDEPLLKRLLDRHYICYNDDIMQQLPVDVTAGFICNYYIKDFALAYSEAYKVIGKQLMERCFQMVGN